MRSPAVFLLGVWFSAAASGATTYTYVGPKYDTTGGAGYTKNMSITGSFTTANPLPANMALTDIGPIGTNLVTGWSFTDGLNTFTKANSIPYGNLSSQFQVQTNAAGNLLSFSIHLAGPLPVNFIGQSIRVMSIITNGSQSQGLNGALCTTVTAGVCTAVGNAPNYGDAFTSGAFAPNFLPLDIDGSITATRYDALTDGVLAIRHLFGLAGPSLTNGALGGTATRTDPVAIKSYLAAINSQLDIDGNGIADALTDGLLIIRYQFGLRGAALVQGAIGAGATRTTPAQIESELLLLMP